MNQNHSLTGNSSIKGITAWCLYDAGSSAFSTIITTFIFAAYFTSTVAANPIRGTELWGLTITLSGVLIALLSPVFGAIADYYGRRKPWIFAFSLMAIIACVALWFVQPNNDWRHFALGWVIVGTVGLEVAMVFYNAMLHEIVPQPFYGRVSGWGWGLGYVGGLLCLLIALLLVKHPNLFGLDTTLAEHIRITGPMAGLWFALFTLPLLLYTPDLPQQMPIGLAMRLGLSNFWQSLRTIGRHHKNILLFLIAHMLYIDGMNTLFAFGGIYASGTFGFSTNDIILLGIALNIGAGLGAGAFAWFDDRFGAKTSILTSLIGLTFFGITLLFVRDVTLFWLFALCLSVFVGPVQASSRSLLARIAPPKKVTECFGLFALSGKATAFLGPWVFGLTTLLFQTQRAGMASVMVFLIVGALLLTRVSYGPGD